MTNYYSDNELRAHPDLHSQTSFYHELTQMIQRANHSQEYAFVAVFTLTTLQTNDDQETLHDFNLVMMALLSNYRKLFKQDEIIGLSNYYAEFIFAAMVKQANEATEIINVLNKLIAETNHELAPMCRVTATVSYHYQIPDDLTFADNLIDRGRKSGIQVF